MRKPFLILTLLVLSLIFLFIFSLPDKNLHFVACDVGQGDALLVTLGTIQVLVDGGPDKKVLSCLSKHMPFWDRKIDIVMVTHPQEDHFGGLVDVVRNYNVGTFLHPDIDGTAQGWQVLKQELKTHKIESRTVQAGNKISTTKLSFDILSPPVGLSSEDLNDYSVVGKLSYEDFDVLLTGDIGPAMISQFVNQITPVEVLKIPHHGSKNGLSREMLDAAIPKLAVISVGRHNRFGHPHEEVLRMLGEVRGVRVLRTDLEGEIEVVSDGRSFWLKD